MANNQNKFHIINNVKARYPKMDRPYRFDTSAGEKGKSVPCAATDDGAAYQVDFVMTPDQAKDLYKVMNTEYKNSPKRDADWNEKLDQPFKEQEDGTFVGKASIKAAYDSVPTKAPDQFDAKVNKLPEGFQLTTGSTVNIAVAVIPYKVPSSKTTGVTLRLRSVQVIDLAEMVSSSPFEATEGFVNADGFSAAPVTNGAAPTSTPAKPPEDDADELFAEPKVKTPKADIIPATPEAKEVTNLLDKWDDE
jgi:hypothetical protein